MSLQTNSSRYIFDVSPVVTESRVAVCLVHLSTPASDKLNNDEVWSKVALLKKYVKDPINEDEYRQALKLPELDKAQRIFHDNFTLSVMLVEPGGPLADCTYRILSKEAFTNKHPESNTSACSSLPAESFVAVAPWTVVANSRLKHGSHFIQWCPGDDPTAALSIHRDTAFRKEFSRVPEDMSSDLSDALKVRSENGVHRVLQEGFSKGLETLRGTGSIPCGWGSEALTAGAFCDLRRFLQVTTGVKSVVEQEF